MCSTEGLEADVTRIGNRSTLAPSMDKMPSTTRPPRRVLGVIASSKVDTCHVGPMALPTGSTAFAFLGENIIRFIAKANLRQSKSWFLALRL